MNFSTVANIATIILCAAVLVQSVRMMRSLKAVRGGAIADELTVMVVIANASADRMADAADAARRQQAADYGASDHNAGGWA